MGVVTRARSDSLENRSDDDEAMTEDELKDGKDAKNKVRKKKTRTVFSRSQVRTHCTEDYSLPVA